MGRKVDYYFSLVSPWAYLGHAAFMDLAKAHDLDVNFKPVFLGEVFAQTGGQPLSKRHPARQRYRLVEMQRWREKRGLPLNLHPKHWPFDVGMADRSIIGIIASHQSPDAFMRAAFAAVWHEEKDLGDEAVLSSLLAGAGHDADHVLSLAGSGTTEAIYALNLENAVASDVFGSPSYVLDGEVFWGQDRLDLLADALASGRPAMMA